jgi:hypothetical protein
MDVKVSRLLPILLLSCLTATLVYAGYRYVHYYPSDTLTAYDSWNYYYGCEWLDFKVTMDDITTNRRLYVEIQERYYVDDSFVDELFYGYLEDSETSGVARARTAHISAWRRGALFLKTRRDQLSDFHYSSRKSEK